MTNHANDAVPTIGPATEARLQMAFADTLLLTAKATAKLLGLDQGTLRNMADQGVITSVRRGAGSTRAYTEGDIRLYLTQGAAPVPKETKPVIAQPGARKVVSFSEMRRKKRAG